MRPPNYQFEKRRRDLEKKAKNEEKRLRKLEKSANPSQPAVIEISQAAGLDAGDGTADVPPAASAD